MCQTFLLEKEQVSVNEDEVNYDDGTHNGTDLTTLDSSQVRDDEAAKSISVCH